jgi:O-antigen/teichoic acid export membrane protein
MISTMPSGAITQLVNQILLPIISGTARLSQAEAARDFRRARHLFMALGVFAGIGFLACSKPLVALLLNPQYAMTGWMLQMLGVRVALDIFAGPTSTALLAYGQSRYAAAGSTVRLVLMGAAIWVSFTYFGIRQALLSLLLAQALSYAPLMIGLARVLPSVARAEVRWYALFLIILLAALVFWT